MHIQDACEAALVDTPRVGAIFPDYELPDHTDTPRKLFLPPGERPDGAYAESRGGVGYARVVTIIAENEVDQFE